MKSLCLTLVALACCALACAESTEQGRLRPLMPLLPSAEEQRAALVEARLQHGHPLQRLPAPAAGQHGLSQTGRAAVKAAKGVVPKARAPKHAGPREPQPEFAGRVEVRRGDHGLRIINGDKAVLGQFPWQAGVFMDFGAKGKAWCGGSIVHSLWILTAAHCVDSQPNSYTISVGSLGSETGSEATRQEFKGVTETYQHPLYNPYFIDNDIGFVKLPSHIIYSAYVKPVRLPSYSMATDMMVGTTGTVSGWGKTHDTDEWISPDLMYIDNTINDGSACYNYYGNAWIPNKICIQNLDAHSFCSGDSGGAFTFEEEPGVHTQLGIVSFGAAKGCELKLPTAYTRLASFLDFVEDTTNIAIRD